MYSRFDSGALDPASLALIFGRDEVVAASMGQRCLDLELYNNTGNGICGYHYDPVFSTERQLRGGEPGKDSNTLPQGNSMDEGRLPSASSSEVASAHEGGTNIAAATLAASGGPASGGAKWQRNVEENLESWRPWQFRM